MTDSPTAAARENAAALHDGPPPARPRRYTFRVEVVDPNGRLYTAGLEMTEAEVAGHVLSPGDLLRRVVANLAAELSMRQDWRP